MAANDAQRYQTRPIQVGIAASPSRQILYAMIKLVSIGTIGMGALLTNGCNDKDQVRDATSTPPITGVVTLETKGRLDFELGDVRLGEVIRVTGQDWTGTGPVEFYLLTEEEFRTPQLRSEPVRLGQESPGENGYLIFEFVLAPNYERPDGRDLALEVGQKLYVGAVQQTKRGAHSAKRGPLTVRAGGI